MNFYLRPTGTASRYKAIGISLLILGLSTVSLSGPPLADSVPPMQSANYTIDPSQLTVTSGEKSSANYNLTDSVGQLSAGEFDSAGYTVFAGFQYLYALPEFSFSINDLNIDFGTVQAFTFSNDTNILTVSTRSGGYSILAQAEHPLELSDATAEIPFTSCDTPCTISTAAPWVDPDNTGFGFNASGLHASSDFVTSSYFRPYADASQSQTAQTIAAHNTLVTDDTITVTYRLSVTESQDAGDYSSVIDYTAVPTF